MFPLLISPSSPQPPGPGPLGSLAIPHCPDQHPVPAPSRPPGPFALPLPHVPRKIQKNWKQEVNLYYKLLTLNISLHKNVKLPTPRRLQELLLSTTTRPRRGSRRLPPSRPNRLAPQARSPLGALGSRQPGAALPRPELSLTARQERARPPQRRRGPAPGAAAPGWRPAAAAFNFPHPAGPAPRRQEPQARHAETLRAARGAERPPARGQRGARRVRGRTWDICGRRLISLRLMEWLRRLLSSWQSRTPSRSVCARSKTWAVSQVTRWLGGSTLQLISHCPHCFQGSIPDTAPRCCGRGGPCCALLPPPPRPARPAPRQPRIRARPGRRVPPAPRILPVAPRPCRGSAGSSGPPGLRGERGARPRRPPRAALIAFALATHLGWQKQSTCGVQDSAVTKWHNVLCGLIFSLLSKKTAKCSVEVKAESCQALGKMLSQLFLEMIKNIPLFSSLFSLKVFYTK